MPNAAKSFLIKFFQGFAEYLFLFPVILYIGATYVYVHDLWTWLLMFLVIFILGLLVGKGFQNIKKWFHIFVAILVSLTTTYFFLSESLIGSVFFLMLYFLAFYRGVLISQNNWSEIFSPSYLWGIGFPVYFISHFLYRYQSLYSQYLELLTLAAILFIISTFFVSNSEILRSATLSKQKKPLINRSIKNKNRLFIVLTFLLIIFVTSFGIFQRILSFVGGILISIIQSIRYFSFFDEVGGEDERSGGMISDGGLPEIEVSEPSKFFLFMDEVTRYTAYAVYLIIAVLIVYIYYKRIRGIKFKDTFRSMFTFFNQIFSSSKQNDEDDIYIEEKESIFDFKEWRSNGQKRVQQFVQKFLKQDAKWDKLTNREKVRFLYRQVVSTQIKNGYRFQPSQTPSEVIDSITQDTNTQKTSLNQLNVSYSEARYGRGEIADETVDYLSPIFKKEK